MARLLKKVLQQPAKQGLGATLDLDFVKKKYRVRDGGVFQDVPFAPLITVLRSSVGYEVVNGVLTQVSANQPRINEKGLSIYGPRTNALGDSVLTATEGVIATTAVTLAGIVERSFVPSVVNTAHGASTSAVAITTGQAWSFTVLLKQGSSRYVRINPTPFASWGGSANACSLKVDLQLGVVVIAGSGVTNATVTAQGNGVWACSFTVVAAATGNANLFVYTTDGTVSLATVNSAGDAVTPAFFWYNSTWEQASFASGYIPPASSRALDQVYISVLNYAGQAGWYNGSRGTFLVETDEVLGLTDTTVATRYIFEIGNAAVNNRIMAGFTPANSSFNGQVTQAGSNHFNKALTGFTKRSKTCLQLRSDIVILWGNSQVTFTEANNAVPTGLDYLVLGCGRAAGFDTKGCLFGKIRRIRFFPRLVHDVIVTELQKI